MKYVLVIDIADDIAEDYEDFTVDYDFRGTPKENQMVNESIKYIENAEPRPLPQINIKEILEITKRKSQAYKFGFIDGFNYYKRLVEKQNER